MIVWLTFNDVIYSIKYITPDFFSNNTIYNVLLHSVIDVLVQTLLILSIMYETSKQIVLEITLTYISYMTLYQ